MSSHTLTLQAFGKINPSLRVLGKRADAYHELETIFQTVSLRDTIKFTATDDPAIVTSCDDLSLWMGETNLVTRAAKALSDRFSPKHGARIHLQKRIPGQAGLGGGSSDAAATLVGLTYLWELPATADDLVALATTLGADVPFFFYGGTARGKGIGDQIETLSDAPETFLLILKPNANINTADAYRALDVRSLTSKVGETILSSSDANEFFDSSSFASLHNDFEAVAFALEPEIERAKAALLQAGARCATLAGSGSAVFAIFDSEDAQRRAIQAIKLETGWRVFPCRTVGRGTYLSEMGPSGEIFARFFGR